MKFKSFLENLNGNLREYASLLGSGAVTVTITVYGKDYNIYRIMKCGESEVSFAFYDENKSRKAHGEVLGGIAWPALTIPYEEIQAIEFNPGEMADGNPIGFAGNAAK
ncbi:MAG: hypothetical protein ABSH14_06335 [Verrucomicrobiia bacterium]|jgi:hypothetical protein